MKKFSPSFWIFIVLILLFLGVVIYHYWIASSCLMNEGFITFQDNVLPLDLLYVPTYSSTKRVYKLHDNVFFDITNGSLIQANGIDGSGGTVPVDNSGNSITSVVIKKRDGSITPVIIETRIDNGVVTNTDNFESRKTDYTGVKFSEWMTSVMSPNDTEKRNKYQVLYVAWEDLTFLDVIDYTDKTAPTSKITALFDRDTKTAFTKREVGNDMTLNITPTNDYLPDSNDGKMVDRDHKRIFQICSFLQYDTVNGYLLFTGRERNIATEVRNRNNQILTETDSLGITNLPYNCFVIPYDTINTNNGQHQYMVYFVVYQKKTMVIVLQAINNSADLFKIVKVARFDEKGYVKSQNRGYDSFNGEFGSHGDTHSHYGNNQDGSYNQDEYYEDGVAIVNQLFKNDKTLYENDVMLADGIEYIADNYAKKTELVPPVYPVVLSCPSAAGATDGSGNKSGGEGGSGNKSGGGVGETVQGVTGSVVGGVEKIAGGAFDLTKDVVGETTGMIKSAAGGAVDLTKSAAGGAVDVARETAGGAVGIARETAGGAVDLTKSAAGGTVDLLKSAGTGAVNELNYLTTIPKGSGTAGSAAGGAAGGAAGAYGTPYGPSGLPIGGPTSQYPMQYNNKGAVQGVDPYSRYGAMPNKGGDFLPLTASFSAFGK